MIKSNKNKKKKKGFTLVELIAVIAIIGILAAILIPSIGGFITKAKKAKVVEQARTFAMAVESVAADGLLTLSAPGGVPVAATTPVDKNGKTLSAMTGNAAFLEIVGVTTAEDALKKAFPKLPDTITYEVAVKVAAGDAFDIDDNGKFKALKTATTTP